MNKPMNPRRLALAVSLLAVAAATSALMPQRAQAQAERRDAGTRVIAPPKPAVETIVLPGVVEHKKPQRNVGVLRARAKNPANLPGGANPRANPIDRGVVAAPGLDDAARSDR